MTGFDQYRLPVVPDHLRIPRACEPHVARLLGGSAGEAPSPWPADVSPQHVIQGLEWHCIGPVLYQRAIERRELDMLPSWLQQHLKKSFRRSTVLNLASGAALAELIDSLHQAAVPVIVLKGAALARATYEHIGLRPMLDLDLLVRPQNLSQARRVICASEYRPIDPRKYFEREHHLQFVATGRRRLGLFLELHWRLSDQPALTGLLPLEDLWSRSVEASPPFATARMFDVYDQMLHVAQHIAEHNGLPQLRRLCDLNELAKQIARRDGWQTLARRAVQSDLHLVLAACLAESRRWFGTEVPADFWSELAVGLPPARNARRAFARCRQPALIQFEIDEIRSIRRLRHKIAHVLGLLCPDPRFMRLRHSVPSGSAVWPYYLVRLGNGLRAGIKTVFPRRNS